MFFPKDPEWFPCPHKTLRTSNHSVNSGLVVRKDPGKRKRQKQKWRHNWLIQERGSSLLFSREECCWCSSTFIDYIKHRIPLSLTRHTHLQHYCLIDHLSDLQVHVIPHKIWMRSCSFTEIRNMIYDCWFVNALQYFL